MVLIRKFCQTPCGKHEMVFWKFGRYVSAVLTEDNETLWETGGLSEPNFESNLDGFGTVFSGKKA